MSVNLSDVYDKTRSIWCQSYVPQMRTRPEKLKLGRHDL